MRAMLDSLCGRNHFEACTLDSIQDMVEADIQRLEEYKRKGIEAKRAKNGIPKMQSVWPSASDAGTAQLEIETERGAEECSEPETEGTKQSAQNSQMMLPRSKRTAV